ncbi:MAG: Bax inhibitor-1/YccA family membrane protein [Thiobacillaceae bacterium]
MKSGNPAFSSTTFDGLAASAEPMNLPGTINKTAILLAITLIGAAWVWNVFSESHSAADITPYLLAGGIGGFIVALITIFKKAASPYTSPVYALLEGFALGGISTVLEVKYPGIAIQSVGLAFGTMLCMLVAYRSGLIKVTEKFKMGVVAATGAIAVLYLIDIVLMFFGKPISFIHEGGFIGIAFSLFVIGIAALNRVMDFDFIAQGVANRSPKYMKWYAAFGLLVTLVWLYLEILRLLAKRK